VNQTQVVSKAATSVAVTPSAPSGTLTFGHTVTFTAIVSIVSGSPGAPIGTVSFWDGPVGTGTLLRSGVALVTISSTSARAVFTTTATQLSATTHTITAGYN